MTIYEELHANLMDNIRSTIAKIERAPENIDKNGKLYRKCQLGKVPILSERGIMTPSLKAQHDNQLQELITRYNWLNATQIEGLIEVDEVKYVPFVKYNRTRPPRTAEQATRVLPFTPPQTPIIEFLLDEVRTLKAEVEFLKNRPISIVEIE